MRWRREPCCHVFKIKDNMYQVISKSGGFGTEDLLVQLADTILDKKERVLC